MPSRRRVLLASASALAATTAGCTGTGDDPDDDTTDPGTTDPGTGTGTTTDPGAGTTDPGTTTGPGTTDPGTTPPETTTGSPGGGERIVNGSFEDGLAGWTVGRDLPDEPGNPGTKVDASVETTGELAHSGSQSLLLSIDGVADDGTVWVRQAADLSEVQTLSVAVYSEEASFNTRAQVAAYAGPDPGAGLVEADFDRSNAADGHDGWSTFEYPVEADGPGVVAVGTNVVWETRIATVIDDVALV